MPKAMNRERRHCMAALAATAVPAAIGGLAPRLVWARTAAGPEALASAASSALPTLLRFTFSRRRSDPRTQWLILVYQQLLASLGIGFEFVDVPAGRAPLMIESGEVDGELGRTYGYGALFPSLVRIPEPNNRVDFSVFGIASTLPGGFTGWPAVRDRGLRCEYRRGIQEMAALLGEELPSTQVSAVATVEQGVRRLQLRRTDLYVDVREAVEDFFEFGFASPEAASGPRPQMFGVVKATTGHAYLHRRHQALVPSISRALAEMKRQGIVSRLREDARQAFLSASTPHGPASAPGGASRAR